jgi:DNA repair protein RadC
MNGPREYVAHLGPQALSDAELLCLLLDSGPRGLRAGGLRVLELAQALLERFETLDGILRADLRELQQVRGIGPTKAARMVAVREIAHRLKRYKIGPSHQIHTSREAFQLFSGLEREEQEVLSGAFLDTRNRVLRIREIFRGTLDASVARPREILREALRANAAKILVAHNHPSGDPDPSDEDARFTAQLEWAASAIGIPLADHLVIGAQGRYFSFAEAERLGKSPSG